MTDPFYPAKPGEPLLADTWNNMQVKMRDEVRTHTHRGADDGARLDGNSILPTAALTVSRVDASVALTVKNIDVYGRLGEIATSLTTLGNTKLAVTGGGITGGLSVTGSLGVGNPAPANRLDVQAVARTGAHGSGRALYVTGDFAPDDGVEFRHTNGSQGVGLGYNTVYATGSNPDQDLNLKARGTGNVRIASGALMPKPGNAASAGIQFSLGSAGSDDSAFIRYHAVSGDQTRLLIGVENDANDSIGLWQAGAEQLTLINGRVGIRTTDPQATLDLRVPDCAGGWDRLVVTGTKGWGDGDTQYVTIGAGGAAGIMMHNPHVTWIKGEGRASIRYGRSGGVSTGRWWDVGVRDGNAFSLAIDNSEHMLWLTGDGRVGLGTTNPQVPLHIQQRTTAGIRLQEHNGTGRFLSILYEGQGTVVFYHQNGMGYFMTQDGSWNRNSDVALKENISPMAGILERVLALRPVSYDWKATGTRTVGVVAQEVETVFPELVNEVERPSGEKLKGVSYESIGVLAVAAIQELKQQYDAKLKELEQRLQACKGCTP